MSTPVTVTPAAPVADEPITSSPADYLSSANEYFSNIKRPVEKAEEIDEPVVEKAPEKVAAKPAPEPTSKDPLDAFLKKDAPAEKKEEPKVEPEDITNGLIAPPENAKSHAGWQELKKRANTKIAALEAKVAEFESKAKAAPVSAPADEATKARLAELETQNQTYSQRLKLLDLKSHPDFERQFTVPEAQAKAKLSEILTTEEVTDVDVNALLGLKGKAFNVAASEAMAKLTPIAQAEFVKQLTAVRELRAGAEQTLSKADEFIATQRTQVQAKSRVAYEKAAKDLTVFYAPQPVDDTMTDGEKAEIAAFNSSNAELSRKAEAMAFGSINEQTAAEMAHKAVLFDHWTTHGFRRINSFMTKKIAESEAKIVERDTRISELESKLSKISAAKPNVSGGSGASAGAETPKEETYLEASRRYFGK